MSKWGPDEVNPWCPNGVYIDCDLEASEARELGDKFKAKEAAIVAKVPALIAGVYIGGMEMKAVLGRLAGEMVAIAQPHRHECVAWSRKWRNTVFKPGHADSDESVKQMILEAREWAEEQVCIATGGVLNYELAMKLRRVNEQA